MNHAHATRESPSISAADSVQKKRTALRVLLDVLIAAEPGSCKQDNGFDEQVFHEW